MAAVGTPAAANNIMAQKRADPYYTPAWVVRQCIDEIIPFVCPVVTSILEPGAGRGAFVTQLRERYRSAHITAVDIDPYPWLDADEQLHGDFLELPFNRRFDLTVGNPPFSSALEFIRRALTLSTATVLLLRQGFLSSAKRNPFWRLHRPSDVYILANRPHFTEDGSDKADYCFVCWGRPAFNGTTNLHWLPPLPLAQRK